MMPHITVERGDTTTKSRFTGGFKWQVLTEFPVGEDTFSICLSMTETFGYPTVLMHDVLIQPGLCGHYVWDHSYVIDGFDEYEEAGREAGDLVKA